MNSNFRAVAIDNSGPSANTISTDPTTPAGALHPWFVVRSGLLFTLGSLILLLVVVIERPELVDALLAFSH